MTVPSLPEGYDVVKHVTAGRSDCHLTVGFDRERGHIPRFLVQLHYQVSVDPVRWAVIARMDHNETSTVGHDVYREGLHTDVTRRSRRTVHLRIQHTPLPPSRGTVIRKCVDYLRREANYFIDVHEERRPPGRPPRWSFDGGDPPSTFNYPNLVEDDMRGEAPVGDDLLTDAELTELLAEVEGTTPESIERGAADIEISPPAEGMVVGFRNDNTESGDG